MTKDYTTVPCIHCLYLYDWTCWDALSHTMVKQVKSNGLFTEAVFRDCYKCKPKQRIAPEPWKDLNMYYKSRGIL